MSIENTAGRFREPLRNTLLRNGTIAVVVGAIIAWRLGGLRYWPMATLLALWPSFGGHWIELVFLNILRPMYPASRAAQIGVRIAAWFVGGILLAIGIRITALGLGEFHSSRWPAWWVGGLAFVGVELIVHLALLTRGRPNFYDGRG